MHCIIQFGSGQLYYSPVLLDDVKLREYLVIFRFFDYGKSGQLPHQEFKRSLWALGRLPFMDEQPEFERILDVVDPHRDGFITRQAFMAYLVNGRGINATATTRIILWMSWVWMSWAWMSWGMDELGMDELGMGELGMDESGLDELGLPRTRKRTESR
ncbi:hypothetical protein niasHS_008995 [Heterodera schachtii]|uniref:Uncharacterized protein n=2 Tax=Heterodera TaxID=34509 RepID=A0ABD2J733_HETSC